MTFPRHRSRAFTLVEVLISLAIFGMAAVVLSMAYLNVIGSYRDMGSRQKSEEDWKWLRLTVTDLPDRKKIEEGGRLVLPAGEPLTWKAKVEETEVADLFRVTLDAETAQRSGPESWQRTQVIYLFRPAWSDPADRDRLREATRVRLVKQRPT
jgi:general secretion pathway protein I